MFKKFARQYYEEEEMSDELQSEIEKRRLRAEEFMSSEAKHIIGAAHSFHDWYLTECSIYCNHGTKNCRLTLTNGGMTYSVLFSGVHSLSSFGELVSDEANYPNSALNSSLAQVLTLWFDHQKRFEFCLMLDNGRFVTIKADQFSIRK